MRPLWAATAPPGIDFLTLQRPLRTQVVVIGAGYTGLSAALHLAERGRDVVLLEALDIGARASGLNGGQVIAGLKYDPAELLRRFGPDQGNRLITTIGAGPELVFELIRRHGIACDAVRNGWIQAALLERDLPALQARAAQWRQYGVDSTILTRQQAAQLVGTDAYCGGWLDPRGGTVQPLSYARGLARAARRAGARIHTQSPALRLTRQGANWHVATPQGDVTAECVLLATDAYTDGLFEPLRRSLVPVPSSQAATAPLSPALRQSILPAGQSVSDTGPLLRYFRLDSTGRLLMGSRGTFEAAAGPDAMRHLHEAVRTTFPALAGIEFEFHWSGLVAITADRLPHLHQLGPALFAAVGYNGRGIALATTMGKMLARLGAGEPIADMEFPLTSLRPMRLHRFAQFGARAALQTLKLRDRRARRRIELR